MIYVWYVRPENLRTSILFDLFRFFVCADCAVLFKEIGFTADVEERDENDLNGEVFTCDCCGKVIS